MDIQTIHTLKKHRRSVTHEKKNRYRVEVIESENIGHINGVWWNDR